MVWLKEWVQQCSSPGDRHPCVVRRVAAVGSLSDTGETKIQVYLELTQGCPLGWGQRQGQANPSTGGVSSWQLSSPVTWPNESPKQSEMELLKFKSAELFQSHDCFFFFLYYPLTPSHEK